MKKLFKFFAYIFAGLLSLIVLAVIVIKLIPDTQYNKWITTATESATGRNFEIGNLELDLGTALRVRADNIRMANADWGTQQDMLNIARLEADFGLLALLAGKADIRAVVSKAGVLAESNKEGLSNWAIGTEKEQEITDEVALDVNAPTTGLPLHPFLREIRIDDFKLILIPAPQTGASQAETKIALVKHLLVETPEKDTTLTLDADVNGRAITLSGNLGDMEQFLDTASQPLQLKGDLFGNSLSLDGNWGPLLPQQTLNIGIDLQIPNTTSLTEIAGIELENLGAIAITGELSGKESQLTIDPLNITLQGDNAEVKIEGAIADLKNMQGISITTDANSQSLQQFLAQLNLELPVALPAKVALNARIEGGLEELALSDLVLEIKDEGLDIKASASIGDLLNAQKITGQLTGSVESLSLLSKYANLNLPSLGKIQISADIASQSKQLQLNNLDARLISDTINFTLTGQVDDLLTVKGIDTAVDLNIQSPSDQDIIELTETLKQFDVELPVEMLPQSVELSAAVQGSLEKLSLNDIQGEVLDKGVKVGLDGKIDNVLTTTGIEANVTLNSDSIAAFSKYAGSDLPDLGPLEATAQLRSKDDTYSLENLTANLNDEELKTEVVASIADLLAITGIQAEINASVSSLDTLSEIANTELPQTDPLKVKATLLEDASGKPNFDLHAQTGDANVAIKGALESLAVPDKIGLTVSVTAANLTDFNKISQMEFPDEGPLDLSAGLQLEKNNFAVNDLKLQLDNQSLLGNLALTLPENESELTTLQGKLNIPYLNLKFLLPETNPAVSGEETADSSETDNAEPVTSADAENAAIETAATTPGDRLFSTEPILLEQLHDYDIDLTIDADQIDFGKTNLKNIQLAVTLKEGLLSAEPIKANAGAGDINGYLHVDGRGDTPKLDVDLVVQQAPMPNIGGKLDLNVDLTGQGQSIAALMSSLNGQALLVVRDGKIESSFASSFGSGLLSFSPDKDYTDLECAILRVDIVDGMADFDEKLAAQLTEVTWRGGGEINLKTEELQVGIRPKPRKGIPISAGSLATLMYVGGTLKHPKAQLNPTDVAVKYAKYSAYVATGGLTLVAEMVKNKVQANQDVCEKILDGTVFDEEREEEIETGPVEESTESTKSDTPDEPASNSESKPKKKTTKQAKPVW